MPLDSQLHTDGDVGWSGFRSRPDPLSLPAGVAAMARNMRFVRGRAEVRRGIKRLLDGVSVGDAPVVLPVALPGDVAVASLTCSGSLVTCVTVGPHGLVTGDHVNVRGAVPVEYNGDVVVTVTGPSALTYVVAASLVSPAVGSIFLTNGIEIRDSYAGGIFGGTVFSSPDSSVTGAGAEYIALFGADNCYLYRHGMPVLTRGYPSGEVIEEEDSLAFVQAFNKLFLFRSRDLVGGYARKSCSITSSGGVATVTCAGHGFATNNRVCIEGASLSAYNIEADIVVTDANTFHYNVQFSPASPAVGSLTCRLVKPPLMWDGGAGGFVKYGGGNAGAGATYSTLRSTGVCCYQNNRLFVAKTPIKDEILISDVLDPNTFDPLQASFRANAGSDDYIVALHPFAEGETIVFGRKSIYRCKVVVDTTTGTGIDLSQSFVELITNEVGCRAAKTVVTAGSYIYFLSDNGVYRLDTSYVDVKVRGVTLPLSDNIADQFDGISESAAGGSNAVWHDNRYWLAVPTNGSDAPNTLLVWCALTGEWESVDSFPAPMTSLLVSDYADRRRLFGVSRAGKLFLLEEREDGDDAASEGTGGLVPIAGSLTSRRLCGGDLLGKRWMRLVVGVSLPAGAAVLPTVSIFDRSGVYVLGALANASLSTVEYVMKQSVRACGASAQFSIENVGLGRPVVRSGQMDYAMDRPSFATGTEK